MDNREVYLKNQIKGLSLGSKLKSRGERDIMKDLICVNLNREDTSEPQ